MLRGDRPDAFEGFAVSVKTGFRPVAKLGLGTVRPHGEWNLTTTVWVGRPVRTLRRIRTF